MTWGQLALWVRRRAAGVCVTCGGRRVVSAALYMSRGDRIAYSAIGGCFETVPCESCAVVGLLSEARDEGGGLAVSGPSSRLSGPG